MFSVNQKNCKMRIQFERLKFYYQELIYNNISGKKVLILFVLTCLVYFLMLFVTIPKVMGFSGGMKIFDMMPLGYNTEYANTLLKSLGNEGRNVYLFQQIPLDLIFPFLFGMGNCLLLAYFLNKLNRLKAQSVYLCLLPVFASIFDYLENFGITTMLCNYPNLSELLVQTTNLFSISKSLLTTVYFLILIMVLLALGITWLIQSKTQ